MIPWLLLLPLPLPILASVEKTFGVSPALLSKYTPTASASWRCLDGSKEIPWSSVNNDYCDCPDGSDEPGTGACPNSTFYCHNVGHIGTSIPASRVNDGLCETDCCDGSDEKPGVCPNKCKEVGELYRKKRDEERRIRKTGSKIRSTYIAFARKEKTRLESLVQSNIQEIAVREKEVARLKDIAELTESVSAAALAHKQESPLYKALLDHHNALKSLQREHEKLKEREKTLGEILSSLRTGYNPNYQDMAVLEAVRGWEQYAGLPHINDATKDDTPKQEDDAEAGPVEVLEEGLWTAEKLENDLGQLLNTDHVSLLLEHDEHVQAPMSSESSLLNLASYIPDSFLPQYEDLRDTLVSWLRTLGVIRGGSDATADSSRARQALTDAQSKLDQIKKDQDRAKEDLEDLFDPEGYGAEGEWKKLDRTCLEKDTGEYTYEVCLFDEARQKPNKGGTTFSLGKFQSWNPDTNIKAGTAAFYSKQIYKHGTRCWNGPERSVVLLLTCGTENVIDSVVELEKCEYQFTGTTPALCLPIGLEENGEAGQRHSEL